MIRHRDQRSMWNYEWQLNMKFVISDATLASFYITFLICYLLFYRLSTLVIVKCTNLSTLVVPPCRYSWIKTINCRPTSFEMHEYTRRTVCYFETDTIQVTFHSFLFAWNDTTWCRFTRLTLCHDAHSSAYRHDDSEFVYRWSRDLSIGIGTSVVQVNRACGDNISDMFSVHCSARTTKDDAWARFNRLQQKCW